MALAGRVVPLVRWVVLCNSRQRPRHSGFQPRGPTQLSAGHEPAACGGFLERDAIFFRVEVLLEDLTPDCFTGLETVDLAWKSSLVLLRRLGELQGGRK